MLLVDRIKEWAIKQLSKKRVILENEILGHYRDMQKQKQPWDMYLWHRETYHILQARYLCRYGRYYKNDEIKR